MELVCFVKTRAGLANKDYHGAYGEWSVYLGAYLY